MQTKTELCSQEEETYEDQSNIWSNKSRYPVNRPYINTSHNSLVSVQQVIMRLKSSWHYSKPNVVMIKKWRMAMSNVKFQYLDLQNRVKKSKGTTQMNRPFEARIWIHAHMRYNGVQTKLNQPISNRSFIETVGDHLWLLHGYHNLLSFSRVEGTMSERSIDTSWSRIFTYPFTSAEIWQENHGGLDMFPHRLMTAVILSSCPWYHGQSRGVRDIDRPRSGVLF